MSSPLIKCRVDTHRQLRMNRPERERFDALLTSLAGKNTVLALREDKPRRSYDQLRYWFGVPMAKITAVTGYTKMQQHYLCLAICFGVMLDPVTGHEVPVVPASRHLTTKQFSELFDWVGPWAFENFNGLQIPLPNDVDLDSLPGVAEDEA